MACQCAAPRMTTLQCDVVRKLLVKMEQQADLSQPLLTLPRAQCGDQSARTRLTPAVKRRWMKPRPPPSAQGRRSMVAWYNHQVGVSMVQYAGLGRGRRLHILDTTHVEVP